MKKLLFIPLLSVLFFGQVRGERYVGGDISMLPMYEEHNSPYLDLSNKAIDDLLVWFVEECGWNTFRVRLFVNPTEGNGVVQTTEYVAQLGKRIKDAGAYFMLDFHYSDTWVDATHIQAPAAWKGASAEVMADSLSQYTKRTLEYLKQVGATPDLVQVGNEIMYGLCGIKVAPYDNANTNANWPAYINLVKAGCDAVREQCPNAQIIIHTDRPIERSYNQYYYDKLVQAGVDFDIIGLSYYPFWHGTLDNLAAVLTDVAETYGKKILLAETSYAYTEEDTDFYGNTLGAGNAAPGYPITVQGQANLVRDVIDTVVNKTKNGIGVFYWEGTWISVGGSSYEENRALWEIYGSGWATSRAAVYDPVDAGQWYGGCTVENQALFDERGRALESLKVFALAGEGNTPQTGEEE